MNEILNPIMISNRLKCGALKHEFYVKNDLVDLYEYIHNKTDFLNNFNPTFRERIFYIQENIDTVQLCKWCNNKLSFDNCQLKFRATCGSKLCSSQSGGISNIGKRLVPRKETICLGCKTVFKQLPSQNKRYCTQRCWTKHNNDPQPIEQIMKRVNSTKKTKSTIEWKEANKDIYLESYKKLSIIMKDKIAKGEFTPCITNSWTKRTAFIKIDGIKKKFRSNWEAAFWVLNQHLEYEKIRIPYQFENKSHIYIVDFADLKNKILYEIKPDCLVEREKNIIKRKFATEWATENGYSYILISNEWYKNNVNDIDFSIHANLKPYMKQFLRENI